MMELAVQYCSQAFCAGHRADLYLLETAKAIAALAGRGYILPKDMEEAALYVLPHRMRKPPEPQPEEQPPQEEPEDSEEPPDTEDDDADPDNDSEDMMPPRHRNRTTVRKMLTKINRIRRKTVRSRRNRIRKITLTRKTRLTESICISPFPK